MKILAIELSSARGSIAFVADAAESFVSEFANDRKHSGAFFNHLRECVEQYGKPDRIVVGLGPGSYAGTRIAIAAAIGVQAASGAALIGIASVRAIQTSQPDYIVIGDARRNSFYFARVHQLRCVEGPLLCTEPELQGRLSRSGTPVFATEQLVRFPEACIAYPSAGVLARIGAMETPPANDVLLEPIYLRDPHITVPKQMPLVKNT
ncbi:hypothetical protein BH18VER1_BH18VER1_11580 [soil metagenome]